MSNEIQMQRAIYLANKKALEKADSKELAPFVKGWEFS